MSLVHEALKRAAEDHPSSLHPSPPRRFHLSVSPDRAYRVFLISVFFSVAFLTAIFLYQSREKLGEIPISENSDLTVSVPSRENDSQTGDQGLGTRLLSAGGVEGGPVIEEVVLDDHSEVDLSEGIHLYGVGKFNEAAQEYRRNLLIDPENAVILNNLGLSLKALGRLEEAESSYHKALEKNPELVEAINNLALLYEFRDRREDAMRLYRRALKINPDYAAAHLNYASTLDRSGFPSEARRHFEAFLLNNPNKNSRESFLVKKHLRSSEWDNP